MKHYSKAIFSERNALTEVTIGFIWENALLEALETGAQPECCSGWPAGVDGKLAADEGARAIRIAFELPLILANLLLSGSVNLFKKIYIIFIL